MTARALGRPKPAARNGATGLAIGLGLLALGCAVGQLAASLPPGRWLGAAWSPGSDVATLVFHFSNLPRLAVAALAGGALALAGTVVQHVLDNPLAAPGTLGISAGAQLALVAATVFAPASVAAWPDAVATVGGLVAVALTLLVAAPWRFAPAAVILGGLVVGLSCGALSQALRLFNQEYLASVLSWTAGALAQDDWSVAVGMLPRLAGLITMTVLLLRPLTLLGFGEGTRGLGLPAGAFRAAALALAVGFAAVVTASVGTIGFVEIAAPLVARLAGARRLQARLVLAPGIGAALLVIVDTLVQLGDARFGTAVPTGAVTALLAAPLLLWLAPRLRPDPRAGAPDWGPGVPRRRPAPVLVALAGIWLASAAGMTLIGPFGLDPQGATLPWRWPRTVEAGAAGALLATAGAILQRGTGNPLASPEVLGIGSAVVAGFATVLFLLPGAGAPALVAGGTVGATLLAVGLAAASRRSRFAPEQLLVTGLALTASVEAALAVCLAMNDPRAVLLLGWMAGTTSGARPAGAVALGTAAVVLIPVSFLFARVLALLPLGTATARGLGLALGPTRAALLGLTAGMTAIAVLAVGPLSFVGLVGPHLARRLGLAGPGPEIAGAALVGGIVMILADGFGRTLWAPFEWPAGLVATLIGCPYLLVQLRRRG